MATYKNNSSTNKELIDKINIAKGTCASRRIALPMFSITIVANNVYGSTELQRVIDFRRNLPLADVESIVRSFFKRGSYSGYSIISVTIKIGFTAETVISNPDISDSDLVSEILNL